MPDAFGRISPAAGVEEPDFSLQLFDGRSIRVHSLIMRARSTFFDRMFQSKMKESITMCMELPESVSYENMSAVVRFCYTDDVKVDAKNALSVLILSRMFVLPGLTLKVEEMVRKLVTLDNSMPILQFADASHSESLASAVLTTIRTAGKSLQAYAWDLDGLNLSPAMLDRFKNALREGMEVAELS
eukprot:TRINITY_DN3118_c0_g2_i1.p1 TRINITY_DN3118_c0_g2~~TRINITY_DN3118_c0_g2_i1.p1  ORF type:complete len:199 (-),score=52.75 TRINITY_DN3118_c0_g2_i1:189-746(-)